MTLFSTNLDVRMTQGDTPVLRVAIWDENKMPYNTTASGLAALFVLQKDIGDEPIVTKTQNSGITFAAENWVNIPMLAADTNTISGRYIWVLKLTDNAGNVMTVKKMDANFIKGGPAINVFQIDAAVA